MPTLINANEFYDDVVWLDEGRNDQHFQYEIQSLLPCQIMRLLWDGFTLAIDWAQQTNCYDDIQDAARSYSDLVEAANRLPENQCDFWIGRADNHLPFFWMVWMRWLDEWEDDEHCVEKNYGKKSRRLDSLYYTSH
jgi:hypothetical protein